MHLRISTRLSFGRHRKRQMRLATEKNNLRKHGAGPSTTHNTDSERFAHNSADARRKKSWRPGRRGWWARLGRRHAHVRCGLNHALHVFVPPSQGSQKIVTLQTSILDTPDTVGTTKPESSERASETSPGGVMRDLVRIGHTSTQSMMPTGTRAQRPLRHSDILSCTRRQVGGSQLNSAKWQGEGKSNRGRGGHPTSTRHVCRNVVILTWPKGPPPLDHLVPLVLSGQGGIIRGTTPLDHLVAMY